ncbi:MAG: L,D-transpeptidase family protein [Pyrinomonadaceae bacterium]|nr:L,D-transpeptidase family protein [Pyrinomonadaceae bacterium]
MRILLIAILAVTLICSSIYIAGQINYPLPKMENPKILVRKKERKLQIFDGEKLIKTYSISLGFAPEGDKEIEGDGKTPEGEFYVFTKNDKSSFFLSLGVSYPNIEDAERGLKQGLITQEEHDEIVKAVNEKSMPPQKTKLGGEIYIHGGGCDSDWTAGCMALKNEEMQEIFDVIEIGTPIKIEP